MQPHTEQMDDCECVLCVRGDGWGGEGVTRPRDGGDQTWVDDETNKWQKEKKKKNKVQTEWMKTGKFSTFLQGFYFKMLQTKKVFSTLH